MTTKPHTFTERAKAGQVCFGLPEYEGTPTVKINGTAVAPGNITAVPGGILLSAPAAQDDAVDITCNMIVWG